MCKINNEEACADIYVSISGGDDGDGKLDNPFVNIQDAIAYIAKSKFKLKRVCIYLRGGVYRISSAIRFDFNEIGYIDLDIVIKSYPGEVAEICGSKVIFPVWEKFNDKISVCHLDKNLKFDGLVFNKNIKILARYPNLNDKETLGGYSYDALSKDRINSWSNPDGGYVRSLHPAEWGGNSFLINGKDPDGNINLKWVGDNNRSHEIHPVKRMVENIFEELDSPNEWFYNSDTGQLFYFPEPNDNFKNELCEIILTEELINILGRSFSSPLKNISIEDIKFSYSHRTQFTGKYERPLRGDWAFVRSAAITIENAEDITISNCLFNKLGGNAIVVSGYNKDVNVFNNKFQNIGASGILILGKISCVRDPSFYDNNDHKIIIEDFEKGPKDDNYPRNIYIKNNYFYDLGIYEKQSSAVCLSICSFINILKNTIHRMPRAGININDGTFGGHLIESNDLYDCVRETSDHGPINAWGRDRYWSVPELDALGKFGQNKRAFANLDALNTTVIRGNRIQALQGFGIDLDDGCSNYEVYNNLCLGVGVKLRDGFDRRVYNNIIIGSQLELHVSYFQNNDIIYSNIICNNIVANKIWINEGATTFSSHNIYWNFGEEISGFPDNDHFSIIADPLFIDFSANKYLISSNSPAFKLGFKIFPVDDSNFGSNFKIRSVDYKYKTTNPESVPTKFHDILLMDIVGEGVRSAAGLPDFYGTYILNKDKNNFFDRVGLFINKGDVIRSINGQPIKDSVDFIMIMNSLKSFDDVEVIFYRGQKINKTNFIYSDTSLFNIEA